MKRALILLLTILSLSSLSLTNTKAVPAATKAVGMPVRHPRVCGVFNGVTTTDMSECISRQPAPKKGPAKPININYQKLAYDKKKNEWSLSATLIQIKDAYLPGGPGQVALVEYLTGPCRKCTTTTEHASKLDKMWIVISFGENKHSGDAILYLSNEKLFPGEKILLSLSGSYVSESGVNWDKCPIDDEYCHRARLADGNGPTAIDWDNVEINSTNELIWSGHGSSSDSSSSFFGWGVLCWKITVLDDSVTPNPVGEQTSRNHKIHVRKMEMQ